MLQDPEKRFELLATAHRGDAGEEAPLPPQAAAYEALKKKERTPELLAAANAEMESALLTKAPVPETALEAARQGARAVNPGGAARQRRRRGVASLPDHRRSKALQFNRRQGAARTQPEIAWQKRTAGTC